jgi:hypothetical protein
MPKGDPAGYLPNVKKSRKKATKKKKGKKNLSSVREKFVKTAMGY